MEDFAKKQSGESYVDYFVRLFDNKKIYGLTCDQIAELLNAESGQTLGERVLIEKNLPLSIAVATMNVR